MLLCFASTISNPSYTAGASVKAIIVKPNQLGPIIVTKLIFWNSNFAWCITNRSHVNKRWFSYHENWWERVNHELNLQHPKLGIAFIEHNNIPNILWENFQLKRFLEWKLTLKLKLCVSSGRLRVRAKRTVTYPRQKENYGKEFTVLYYLLELTGSPWFFCATGYSSLWLNNVFIRPITREYLLSACFNSQTEHLTNLMSMNH